MIRKSVSASPTAATAAATAHGVGVGGDHVVAGQKYIVAVAGFERCTPSQAVAKQPTMLALLQPERCHTYSSGSSSHSRRHHGSSTRQRSRRCHSRATAANPTLAAVVCQHWMQQLELVRDRGCQQTVAEWVNKANPPPPPHHCWHLPIKSANPRSLGCDQAANHWD